MAAGAAVLALSALRQHVVANNSMNAPAKRNVYGQRKTLGRGRTKSGVGHVVKAGERTRKKKWRRRATSNGKGMTCALSNSRW